VNGRELQRAVIELARRLGWRVAHFPPVPCSGSWRTPVAADGKGFLDLILLRERLLVVEVKGDNDRLRREQKEWISAWRLAGFEPKVWTPAGWDDGTIRAELERREREA
jgi:hypothetical protein